MCPPPKTKREKMRGKKCRLRTSSSTFFFSLSRLDTPHPVFLSLSLSLSQYQPPRSKKKTGGSMRTHGPLFSFHPLLLLRGFYEPSMAPEQSGNDFRDCFISGRQILWLSEHLFYSKRTQQSIKHLYSENPSITTVCKSGAGSHAILLIM